MEQEIVARLGSTALVLIDGPAGAGKTRLATHLVGLRTGQVVHMDDLYGGWTPDFVQVAEQIRSQIVQPWSNQELGHYRRFDWHENSWAELVSVTSGGLLIIEGVGAAHPLIREMANLTVWLDADSALRRDRVLARDGLEVFTHLEAWANLERDYFAQAGLPAAADLHFMSN